jgi:8-oxo-dGTP diphosphatase
MRDEDHHEGYTYRHPRPMVTVDAAVLRRTDGGLEVLLVRRGGPPFEGMWALPGGFVGMDEELADAAARELAEETGLEGVDLVQIGAFGRPGRDPRGRNISVAFTALIADAGPAVRGGDDASEARWFSVDAAPPLAFDHAGILAAALVKVPRGPSKSLP